MNTGQIFQKNKKGEGKRRKKKEKKNVRQVLGGEGAGDRPDQQW